jgi:hypothetical protein
MLTATSTATLFASGGAGSILVVVTVCTRYPILSGASWLSSQACPGKRMGSGRLSPDPEPRCQRTLPTGVSAMVYLYYCRSCRAWWDAELDAEQTRRLRQYQAHSRDRAPRSPLPGTSCCPTCQAKSSQPLPTEHTILPRQMGSLAVFRGRRVG